MVESAQVSDEKIKLFSKSPIDKGLIPLLSRPATMESSVITKKENAPVKRGYASWTASKRLFPSFLCQPIASAIIRESEKSSVTISFSFKNFSSKTVLGKLPLCASANVLSVFQTG